MKNKTKEFLIVFAFVIFIGYKRISMIGIAFAPMGIWLLSSSKMPNGFRSDAEIFDNPLLYLIGGASWFVIYIIFGFWLERFLSKILKN